MKVPFVSLHNQHEMLREALLEKMKQALEDSAFILGKEVENFETEYARFSGTAHCVGVGNGTDALKICLQALAVKPGHEVLLPANSFIATATAVIETGAKPILADVDLNTCNLSVQSIDSHFTLNTTAIIPVHLYGTPCPMDEILAYAKGKSIYVVEDNAQAQGATYSGKVTGSFGAINATSFYPTKNLGALGDAGAITTDNPALFEKARLLRNLGSKQKYNHEIVGYNSRLDTLQAAFLSVKLPYVKTWNEERRRIAHRYNHNLASCKSIRLPLHTSNSVFHVYVIQTSERNALQHALQQKNIQTLIHYPTPIHLQPAFKSLGYGLGDFPVAEKLSQEVLSLPLYVGMTNDEIDYVCESILQFYQ